MSDLVDDKKDAWFKFYPTDWRGDEKLRTCSLAARGLWLEMICLMRTSSQPGYLLIHGKPPTVTQLALQAGVSVREARLALEQLKIAGVYSKTADDVVYSRRIVREARRSAVAKANGSQGGNPALVRRQDNGGGGILVAGLDNQITNTQIPETRNQTPQPPKGLLTDPESAELAGRFMAAYPRIYARCRNGAFIRLREARDFPTCVQLAHDYRPLDRLEAMLELFLKRTDIGPKNQPGTPNQFAHMAPDCDRLLREHGR